MGSNRRYADSYDRAAIQKIYDRAMAESGPESLRPQEIDLEHEPLTRSPRPRPVTAWVRYRSTPVRVDGWATAWTDKAAAIFWATATGDVHRAWVWWNAITWRTASTGETPPVLRTAKR